MIASSMRISLSETTSKNSSWKVLVMTLKPKQSLWWLCAKIRKFQSIAEERKLVRWWSRKSSQSVFQVFEESLYLVEALLEKCFSLRTLLMVSSMQWNVWINIRFWDRTFWDMRWQNVKSFPQSTILSLSNCISLSKLSQSLFWWWNTVQEAIC